MPKQAQDLPLPANYPSGVALGLNNHGIVVGRAETRWRDFVGSLGGSLTLRTTAVYARGLNFSFEYAHGLDAELGIDSFRVVLGSSF